MSEIKNQDKTKGEISAHIKTKLGLPKMIPISSISNIMEKLG